MQVIEYNENLIPHSDYCVFLPHQQKGNWVGPWNYLKIVIPNIRRYCQHYDIDLVLLTNFRQSEYGKSNDQFNRSSKFVYIANQVLLEKYKYVFTWASSFLLKRNMPHITQLRILDYDITAPSADGGLTHFLNDGDLTQWHWWDFCDDPFIRSQFVKRVIPPKDFQQFKRFYSNKPTGWWSGPAIILNKSAIDWVNAEQMVNYEMQDMTYRYILNAQSSNNTRLNICQQYKIYQFEYLVQNVFSFWSTTPRWDAFTIMHQINKFDLSEILQLSDFKILHFGACGAYSSLYKLRYLLIHHLATKYKSYLW